MDTIAILTLEEFRAIYEQMPKVVKKTLQQAKILFPTPPLLTPYTNHPQPTQQTPTNITHNPTPITQHTIGQTIQEFK